MCAWLCFSVCMRELVCVGGSQGDLHVAYAGLARVWAEGGRAKTRRQKVKQRTNGGSYRSAVFTDQLSKAAI